MLMNSNVAPEGGYKDWKVSGEPVQEKGKIILPGCWSPSIFLPGRFVRRNNPIGRLSSGTARFGHCRRKPKGPWWFTYW